MLSNRNPNTTKWGSSFSPETIQAVWEKGQVILGVDLSEHRLDACGSRIGRRSYGQTTTEGWEVDHIKPVSSGGTDSLDNLQPLQWKNNRRKADNWPNQNCGAH